MNKKRFWILAFLLAWFGRDGAHAQQKQPVSSLQEDCGVTFAFTAVSSGAQAAGTTTAGSTGTTSVIDNRQAGCLDWLVTYSATTTVTALSLVFQTATDVSGVPTTWSNYPGTLNSGINPNTAATTGGAVTDATGTKYPFLRMNLTSKTGAGTVQGKLYGWKRRPISVSIPGAITIVQPVSVNVLSGGGCVGTIATPCVVVGPTAALDPSTTSPVLVAGQDGTPGNVQVIRTNGAGALEPAAIITTLLDGRSNTRFVPQIMDAASATQPTTDITYPYLFNGVSWDRQFICTNQAILNTSSSGNVQLIAASGSTVIRICHISLSTVLAEDIKLTYGTGAACVTGTTDLTGLYKSVQSFDFEFGPQAALKTPASQGVCLNQSVAQATGVTVVYAQF